MSNEVSFVRGAMLEEQAPPSMTQGPIAWMRTNLFSGVFSTILTLIGAYLVWLIVPPIINFSLVDAVWDGTNREACKDADGACWPYVSAFMDQFIYGRYPAAERWRVDLVYLFGALLLIPALIPSVPHKRLTFIMLLLVYPIFALIMLTGGHFGMESLLPVGYMDASAVKFWIDYIIVTAVFIGIAVALARATEANISAAIVSVGGFFGLLALILVVCQIDFGLQPVETSVWGGLLVTLVIAVTGIAASLPIGILLALGRRSDMPVIRLISVIFIEFWRGVPLITVLFMSSVMLPLFIPEDITIDKLFRALIGVALFASAYMAEVVRGGLQAIPKGQYEGAQAMGLKYWQMMRLIILPQALRLVIPGIVNTFIGLFKDTTLVLIIGLFDLLGMVQASFTDPKWASPYQSHTGYLFAAVVFWVFCFAMSRYSIFTENRLRTGHKR